MKYSLEYCHGFSVAIVDGTISNMISISRMRYITHAIHAIVFILYQLHNNLLPWSEMCLQLDVELNRSSLLCSKNTFSRGGER